MLILAALLMAWASVGSAQPSPSDFRYSWPCDYVSNYDGDTITLKLDRGFSEYKIVKGRLLGIDTPEMKAGKAIPKERRGLFRKAGKAAQVFVQKTLTKAKALTCLAQAKPDKYGRPIMDILIDGQSLVALLLEARLGVAYDGGNRDKLMEQHWANIQALQAEGRL